MITWPNLDDRRVTMPRNRGKGLLIRWFVKRGPLAIICIFIVAVLSSSISYAATLSVCASGCDFSSIQDAVDAAEPEDVIELEAEAFYENVIVGKDLTIRGTGAERTVVDGAAGDHVFQHTDASLTLVDMTIKNADIGIESWGDEMILENCVIRENTIGVMATTSWRQEPPVVIIRATTINGAQLPESETCVQNEGANLTLERSTISGCRTGVLTTGTLSGDESEEYGQPGYTSITSSTITATDSGVFVACYPFNIICSDCGPCRQAHCMSGSASLEDSTIAASSEYGLSVSYECPFTSGGGGGGGIFDPGKAASDSDYPPCPGCFASLTVKRSLVSDSGISDCIGSEGWSGIQDEGFNLSRDGTCPWNESTDPHLLPLADNGGPTPTHALSLGSPAIDMGGGDCGPTDQRGVVRPQDGDGDDIALCDIGAYEYEPVPDPLALLDELSAAVSALGLHHGIENALLAKLSVASMILGDLQEANDCAAANSLGAFINQIEASRWKKIPAEDADALIEATEEIIGLLGDPFSDVQ